MGGTNTTESLPITNNQTKMFSRFETPNEAERSELHKELMQIGTALNTVTAITQNFISGHAAVSRDDSGGTTLVVLGTGAYSKLEAILKMVKYHDQLVALVRSEIDSGRNFGGDGDLYKEATDILSDLFPKPKNKESDVGTSATETNGK